MIKRKITVITSILLLTFSLNFKVMANSENIKDTNDKNAQQVVCNDVESNGSIVVRDGEWIYYSGNKETPLNTSYNVSSETYKIKVDSSEKQKLTNDYASKIWCNGDWVYYINYKGNYEDSSFYRIKKDGTSRQEVSRDIPISLIIDKDYMYYSKYNCADAKENLSIYKMKLDGNEKKLLASSKGRGLKKVGEYIYYQNVEDNYSINRVKIDGTDNKLVCKDSSINYMNIVDNWIYYCNNDDKDNLYRVSLDGSVKEKVNYDNSRNINIVDGYIYYTAIDAGDTATLYKSKLDGSEKTKLSSIDSSTAVVVKGDFVYFCGYNSKGIYKIKKDGTNLLKLSNKDSIISMNIVGHWIYYEEINKSNMSKVLNKVTIQGYSEQLVR